MFFFGEAVAPLSAHVEGTVDLLSSPHVHRALSVVATFALVKHDLRREDQAKALGGPKREVDRQRRCGRVQIVVVAVEDRPGLRTARSLYADAAEASPWHARWFRSRTTHWRVLS